MYFKKEIISSFFIITISASNLYMPMIWLYLFLLDFLIPFLCDQDLQWGSLSGRSGSIWDRPGSIWDRQEVSGPPREYLGLYRVVKLDTWDSVHSELIPGGKIILRKNPRTHKSVPQRIAGLCQVLYINHVMFWMCLNWFLQTQEFSRRHGGDQAEGWAKQHTW